MSSLNSAICAVLAICGCVGCRPPAQVAHYRLPKAVAPSNAETTSPTDGAGDFAANSSQHRMLAAIVPTEVKVWFFKLTGPSDLVAQQAAAFRQLTTSITFDAPSANPKWTLPAGWTAQPASGMRFATLQTAAGEVSVISLPAPQDDNANIERWRGQLRLPPMGDEDQPERIALGPYEAVLVNLVGKIDSSKMMSPPFAGRTGNAPAPVVSPPGGSSVAGRGFECEQPDGWQAGQAGGMRRAAYRITDGDQTAEVTVITLPGQAGNLLSNVNRWRDQIGLPPLDAAGLEPQLQTRVVNGQQAHYVYLIGPEASTDRRATAAAMLLLDDVSWFFKLTGPADLVQQELGRFDSFVASVTFTD